MGPIGRGGRPAGREEANASGLISSLSIMVYRKGNIWLIATCLKTWFTKAASLWFECWFDIERVSNSTGIV